MTGQVICLGDAMIDIIAVLNGPLAAGSDTPAPISFRHGGAAANTAAWLAALHVPVTYAGRVGDDLSGREVIQTLQRQGVVVEVSVDPVLPTGCCLVLVSPDGERTMVPSAGANDRLDGAHLSALALSPDDRLHVSGYSLLKDGSRDAAMDLLGRAIGVGARISVDAASASPIKAFGAQRFLDLLSTDTLLLANCDEASVLTGCTEPAAAAQVLARHCAEVIVKCGPDGAMIAVGDDLWVISTPSARVLDSTGAGDAFAAGVLAALLGGADLATAVAQGNAVGARAVASVGARPPGV